jgi:flagellar protein FlbT
MPAAAANTPARRIYFAIQNAYLAQEEERAALLERVDSLIRDFQEATVMDSIKRTLQTIKDHVDNHQHYQALKLTTIVIRHEEKVLNLEPWQKPKPRATGS